MSLFLDFAEAHGALLTLNDGGPGLEVPIVFLKGRE
jgi:hypothetical protein